MSNTSKNADMPAMLGLLSNPSMMDSVMSIDLMVDASVLIADKILTDLEKQQ